MKDMLLHVFRYGLFAALCGTIIVSVLLVMGASLQAIGPVLGAVVCVSWAVGMFPATLRLLRRGARPVITVAVVAWVTAGVLSAGILLHDESRETSVEYRLVRSMSQGTIEAGRIYQGAGYSLIVDDIVGSEFGPMVIVDHTETLDERIQVYAEGYWDQIHQELIVPDGPDIDLRHIGGLGLPVMPQAVRNTVADTLRLMDTATLLWRSPIPFIDDDRVSPSLPSIISPVLVVLVLTLLLTVVWTPLRLTRWPLLNAVVGVGYLRAVVALPAAVDRAMQGNLFTRWMPALSHAELVLVAWVAVLLGIGLVGVILPPLTTWRHNMNFQERSS